MEKEFIPYDLAFRMKAIGYNEVCFGYYNHKKELHEVDPNSFTAKNSGVHYNVKIYNIFNKSVYKKLCTAPTWQSAFRWFREKYQLHSTITSISQESWQWHITKPGESLGKLYNEDFYTYEEAESACLDKLIEIVKTK